MQYRFHESKHKHTGWWFWWSVCSTSKTLLENIVGAKSSTKTDKICSKGVVYKFSSAPGGASKIASQIFSSNLVFLCRKVFEQPLFFHSEYFREIAETFSSNCRAHCSRFVRAYVSSNSRGSHFADVAVSVYVFEPLRGLFGTIGAQLGPIFNLLCVRFQVPRFFWDYNLTLMYVVFSRGEFCPYRRLYLVRTDTVPTAVLCHFTVTQPSRAILSAGETKRTIFWGPMGPK